jgi:hypothetical protein
MGDRIGKKSCGLQVIWGIYLKDTAGKAIYRTHTLMLFEAFSGINLKCLKSIPMQMQNMISIKLTILKLENDMNGRRYSKEKLTLYFLKFIS